MGKSAMPTLTEAEHKVMNVVWHLGQASVKEVTDTLAKQRSIAYNTVLTLLKILYEKGFVSYEKQGRAFIYHPLVDRQHARTTATQHLLKRFFNGSPSLLVQNLLNDESISREELQLLKDKIANLDEEQTT